MEAAVQRRYAQVGWITEAVQLGMGNGKQAVR
jgi:hypothetical protein